MATTKYTAMAAKEAGGKLEKMEFEFGPLGDDDVELDVISGGICHSDVSMWKNEWGMSAFPFVGGHENYGTVAAVGKNVTTIKVGQKAGIGWLCGFCNSCKSCRTGDHNLCTVNKKATIIGRHGGFATKVRAEQAAVNLVPEGYEGDHVGPLFCGGATVFTPIAEFAKPGMNVGVIGIGGLGSMAVQFASKWGCNVTAFTSSPAKRQSALELGAKATISSTDKEEIAKAAGTFDLIISTVNVTLDWATILSTLGPRGRLHLVGATMEPIPVSVFSIMQNMGSVSSSPVGSPAMIDRMLAFAKLHDIKPPVTKVFKFEEINEAFAELDSNPQGRIVLKW